MKTVLFFHRMELTDLFAPVAQAVSGQAQVVHLAYGHEEAERLKSLGVQGTITVFKDEVGRLYPTSSPDLAVLAAIDDLFQRHTNGAFNLNGAIQSDRGFSTLTLDEAHRLTITYHRFWSEFLDAHEVDAVVHEPCSLMFNFVAAMICAERGGHYLYNIMVRSEDGGFSHLTMSGFDFSCPELDMALEQVESKGLKVDHARCDAFLTKFHSEFSVFLAAAFKKKGGVPRLAAVSAYQWCRRLFRGNPFDRVLENIDYWLARQTPAANRLINIARYAREIHFDDFDPDHPYYFYPLHLEPEAVVLYHAHGLYANQVKLIQNIAAQLPPGILLYVKDHPHDVGYRSADDYHALAAVPNIRLIDSAQSGRSVTASSLGVITLTGTAGFEALLLEKRVFTFGKTFYSAGPGVVLLRNIRDLRTAIYSSQDEAPVSEMDLCNYLTAYLAAIHPGLTDYFAGRARRYGIDLDENARRVADGLLSTLQKLWPS